MSQASLFASETPAETEAEAKYDPMRHHERAGLRKIGNPYGYRWCRSEVFDGVPGAFKLTFARHHGIRTKGKAKGWPKFDMKTAATTIVLPADIKAEQAAYEAETGNCHCCQGTKRESSGWSITDGQRWVPCRECKGAGLSKEKRP
jgi:hypothetical protein